MSALVEQSSIDDIEWFLQMLELQLEETPHHVKDKKVLADIQEWHRRVRTTTLSTLHNKRVADRPRKWALRAGEKLLYIALGAIIALALRNFI